MLGWMLCLEDTLFAVAHVLILLYRGLDLSRSVNLSRKYPFCGQSFTIFAILKISVNCCRFLVSIVLFSLSVSQNCGCSTSFTFQRSQGRSKSLYTDCRYSIKEKSRQERPTFIVKLFAENISTPHTDVDIVLYPTEAN